MIIGTLRRSRGHIIALTRAHTSYYYYNIEFLGGGFSGCGGCLGESLGLLGARWRQSWDLGVLELGAVLANEFRTAVGEWRGLVSLLAQLALGVGLGKWSAVLDELEETAAVVVGWHAGRTAAERRQVPGLFRLDGGALGRSEAHTGEVCE